MKNGFLFLIFCTMVLACASQPNSGDRAPASVVSAAEFCSRLKARPPMPGQSLRHVRETMTELELISRGVSLGARANEAAGAFANADFVDTLPGYPNLLDHPSHIADGSVFLMRRSANCARVNANTGHVAVQCDGRMILVQRGFPEVDHATYKQCVYSVQRHLAWGMAANSAESEGDDIEGQQAHP